MRRNRTPEEQAAHEAFEREQADILGGLPPEFRGPVAAIAWEYGHANGYRDVLGYATDIAGGLEHAIKDYTKRITTPSIN
jgi:hypothetical protein